MVKFTILVVGPKGCQKTAISNALAELQLNSASDNTNFTTRPTQGVRILEFQRTVNVTGQAGKSTAVDVELWDCSGDNSIISFWPTISSTASGLIHVTNISDTTGSDDKAKELEKWISFFPKLSADAMVVFAHQVSTGPASKAFLPSFKKGNLAKVKMVQTQLSNNASHAEALRSELDGLIVQIMQAKEREEKLLVSKA